MDPNLSYSSLTTIEVPIWIFDSTTLICQHTFIKISYVKIEKAGKFVWCDRLFFIIRSTFISCFIGSFQNTEPMIQIIFPISYQQLLLVGNISEKKPSKSSPTEDCWTPYPFFCHQRKFQKKLHHYSLISVVPIIIGFRNLALSLDSRW